MPVFEQPKDALPGHRKILEMWLDGNDHEVYVLVDERFPEGAGALIADMAMNVFARAFGNLDEVYS